MIGRVSRPGPAGRDAGQLPNLHPCHSSCFLPHGPPCPFSPVHRHLTSYSFPLNLDELRTIVERVAIQAKVAQLELATAAVMAGLSLPDPPPAPSSSVSSGCSGCSVDFSGSQSACAACGPDSGGCWDGGCGCGSAALNACAGEEGEELELCEADFWHATEV